MTWKPMNEPPGKPVPPNGGSVMLPPPPQPAPTPSVHPPLWELVAADMQARDAFGRRKYGTPLQAHNGRDALRDAYEEALDLCVYLRQAIYERDHPTAAS